MQSKLPFVAMRAVLDTELGTFLETVCAIGMIADTHAHTWLAGIGTYKAGHLTPS